jgi:hypothetical protein
LNFSNAGEFVRVVATGALVSCAFAQTDQNATTSNNASPNR